MHDCEKVSSASNSSKHANESNGQHYADIIAEKEVSLNPNPAHTSFTINYTSEYNSYLIEELSGKIIERGILSSAKTSLLYSTSDLSNGIYVITLQGKDDIKKLKLIISK